MTWENAHVLIRNTPGKSFRVGGFCGEVDARAGSWRRQRSAEPRPYWRQGRKEKWQAAEGDLLTLGWDVVDAVKPSEEDQYCLPSHPEDIYFSTGFHGLSCWSAVVVCWSLPRLKQNVGDLWRLTHRHGGFLRPDVPLIHDA